MRLIPVPYKSDTRHNMFTLPNQQNFIWYHNGLGADNAEWFSCWPSVLFEYLGNNKTRISDSEGTNNSIVEDDWFNVLKKATKPWVSHKDLYFTGGLAGHLSYDLGLELLNIHSDRNESAVPLAIVGRYDWCYYTDHSLKKAWVAIQPCCPEATQKLIQEFVDSVKKGGPVKPNKTNRSKNHKPVFNWQCNMLQTHYNQAFKSIKNYIVEGDIYQANLTRQWSATITTNPTPEAITDWLLYQQLIDDMPAPFSVFQKSKSHSLLSVSPERFIQIKNGDILTQPIKGTRPRGGSTVEDDALKNELLNSEKDRAENLMIVDLLRNDIAKCSVPGSVKVDRLFEIQSFKNVHHLVSSISAKLAAGSHPIDVLKHSFPGGSITGAPKKRAMEVISELETAPRGNYCGCSFVLGADDYFDSSILIRTLTLTGNTLTCGGGGGIVHDSEVDDEYEESFIKVSRLLNSLANTDKY